MSKAPKKISTIQVTVPVLFFYEDDQWVAYCPPLELSTYGDTQKDARMAFADALDIFFEETSKLGTLEKELIRLGWTLTIKNYEPPSIKPRTILDLVASGHEIVERQSRIRIPMVA